LPGQRALADLACPVHDHDAGIGECLCRHPFRVARVQILIIAHDGCILELHLEDVVILPKGSWLICRNMRG
jgi:hypothetical protein